MINLFEMETQAAGRMDPAAWGYFAGGANDEITLRGNRDAWDRLAIRYRTMVDVTTRSLGTTVLGQPIDFPVLVAPTAMQKLAHPDGESAMARAAGACGTLMVVSTTATTSLEEVRKAATGPTWFQLYIYQDRGATRALLERARDAGYSAIVITVDTPLLGWRERDIRNGFTLPPHLTIANAIAAGAGHDRLPTADGEGSGLAKHLHALHDAALSPRDIEWAHEVSGLPIVLKGIVRGDDAVRALDHGAAGVIVSNHGGRQLDTSIATARALPEVVDAVGDRGEVYVDGGIRRGTDVLKALALGARAVLVGRPPLWGLAVGGEKGATEVLQHLRMEFDLAMALAGCTSVAELTRDLVVDA
ncbi:MAG: alpha-hydroxy-acid oxidizing protein [Gemmatimonadetes bacterium]|nr:alpha-hydroxy-acid oxidizing protein [Gemmatimonadota bacterium]MCC6770260.1 alpha-hydroxy-acid oxidizing protein [Gemmatimonadaceae bacterium]